jgi:tetratricopeptide (TPR) repeat protein
VVLGLVAGCFGEAFGEIGDFANAIEWYERAIGAEDSSAGLRALEQLGNLKARLGEKQKDRKSVEDAIALLEHVVATSRTMERVALLGSAYQRLANVVPAREASAALREAQRCYKQAEDLASSSNPAGLFYPALNCLSLEVRLSSSRAGAARKVDANRLQAVRRSLEMSMRENPDFWAAAGSIELEIYAALLARQLGSVLDAALFDLGDLLERASSKKDWDSVFFQMRETLHAWKKSPGLDASERAAAEKLLAAIPRDQKPAEMAAQATAPANKAKKKQRKAKKAKKAKG